MFSFSSLTSSVSSLASSVQASVTALVQEQKQKLAQEQAKLEETKQQQEAAEQAKQRGAYPLWTIYNEDQQILEAELKERILKLATDIKTWQIPDPPREQFPATMEFMLPFVVEALKHDKNLERAQYRLVPRKMSEEKFWRLYMYHIERYRAEMQVGSLFTPPKHFRLSEPIAALALARPITTSTPSKPATSFELSSMLSVEEPHASDSDYVSDEYVKVANRKLAAAAAAAASSSSSTSTSSASSSSTSTSSTTATSTTSTQSTRIRTDDDDLEELESMLADVDVSNTDMLSGDTNLHDLNDLVIEEELP